MPTAPSTPIRRWFVASSAPAGAGPRCARAPQTDEGHAINVSKEALARLRQRSAMTQCAWEAMTYQPRVVQQKIIQPALRYQGADRDQRKVESHLTPLVRLESELVVAVAHIGLAASPMSRGTPIVFVVDDDVSVRESLELLIRNVGWQPETFESAQDSLSSTCPCPELSDSRRYSSRARWLGITETRRGRPPGHADHLHHGSWRRSDDGSGHERRSSGVLDEALRGRRIVERHRPGPGA